MSSTVRSAAYSMAGSAGRQALQRTTAAGHQHFFAGAAGPSMVSRP